MIAKMPPETFKATWESHRSAAERALEEALSPRRDLEPGLLEVLRYSVLGGGKRIRPVLCLAACEAVGGRATDALPAGIALELIHAYSLVHDDMPCMDDDDLRRGQPTVHKKWDEATAVLAGDALQAEAFMVVSDRRRWPTVSPEAQLQIVREVAAAAGSTGMVGGQYLDICARTRRLERSEVETLHRLKTGALIRAAAVCGGLAAGAAPLELAALSRYGAAVGLLFQLTDDLLDATEVTAGQTAADIGAAEAAVNYYVLLGEQALRAAIAETVADALDAVDVFAPREGFLRGFVDAIATREA